MKIPELAFIFKDGQLKPYDHIAAESCEIHLKEGEVYKVTVKSVMGERLRTLLQNSCMWLYLTKLATAFNDGGLDIAHVLSFRTIDVPWSKDTVKELLWDDLQKAMYMKDSSTELDTKEPGEVHKVLDIWTLENLDVSINWPNKFDQSYETIQKQ